MIEKTCDNPKFLKLGWKLNSFEIKWKKFL